MLASLGAYTTETTLVLVPEAQAQAALELISETVTDYEGEELDALLEEMASLEGEPGEVEVEGDRSER